MRSRFIALLFVAMLVAPAIARAQLTDPLATTTAPAEPDPYGETLDERRADQASSEAETLAEEQAVARDLAPAVADARLAEVDDGIDEIFAAWASERVFSGTSTGQDTSLMLLTQLGVRFGIARDVRARADWGFAYSSSHVMGDFMESTTTMVHYDARVERVETQNPTLQFEWAPVIANTRFSFGLGVSAPTAAGENIATTAALQAAYDGTVITHDLMLATAGGLNPWRYRRERMALFIPVTFLFPIDRITIALEGAAAISAPVIGAGAVPTTGDLQADVQIAGDILPELRLGARLAISVLNIGANVAPGTIVQPSATGYVRVRLDPVFLIASVLADVGGYYGLGSGVGLWSATLGFGAAIP